MLEPYEEYVSVDTKWVQQVPAHWSFDRIKQIFAERKESNAPIKTDFILSLSASSGVSPYHERTEKGGNKPKEDLSKYSIAHENDLLVNCMNVVAGSAGVSKWHGAISPVYYALYPRSSNYNVWYYHSIFRLLTFQRSLVGLGKGILMHETESGKLNTVRMRIPMSNLNNVQLPIPPREEQDQIVRYLDWKLSQISRLIKAKKKQIALLKEQKRAEITEAMLSVQCNKLKLKHIVSKLNRPYSYSDDVVICSNNGKTFFRGDKKIGVISEKEDIYQGVQSGDLMIHGMDTWHGAIALSEHSGKCTTVVHVCDSAEDKRYIMYFLQMLAFRKLYKAISNGVRQNTSDFRSWAKAGDIEIVLPPLTEQKKLADYLDDKSKRIDYAIEKIHQETILFEEYRTRLVSDVVTGKVDVRGIHIPAYQPETDEAPDADEETDEDTTEEETVDEE